MIKSENYITIQGWMITELGLYGNDLIVYALIYGFTQTKETMFTGSIKYIMAWLNGSRSGVIKNLTRLCEMGLLIKYSEVKNGVTFNSYNAVPLSEWVVHKVNGGGTQSVLPSTQSEWGGGTQSVPNNTILDKIENNTILNNRIDADFQKNEFSTPLELNQKEKEKSCAKKEKEMQALEVLEHLNKMAGKRYTATKTNLNFITARLGEGNSVIDLKRVIELKTHEWSKDPKMNTYLRPETLFNATKFQTYIQQVQRVIENPQQFVNEQRTNNNGANRNRPDSAENIASMFSHIDSAFGS